jgi:hypothetical protein
MTQLFHRLHIALVLLILVGLPLPAAELPTEAKQAEAAFDSELRQKVEPPYEEGIKALRARYRQAIEAALKSASSMGRLDESLALKEELLHTVKGDSVPETDEPGTNSEVVRLRGIWRQEKERMDKERNARLKGIAEQHDAVMRRIEERLTRELKLEEAKAVRERRDSLEQIVKAGAGGGLPKTVLGSASGWASSPASATKDKPFINSLGMKFVPVPGTKVLFCIHETRKLDFEEYLKSKRLGDFFSGVEWEGLKITSNDFPALVSWDDAYSFCKWLSSRDNRTYRLPTDREWSFAVGIGELEDPVMTPRTLAAGLSDIYPWGSAWPPPSKSGNLPDEKIAQKDSTRLHIDGYDDGYSFLAPVMSFTPNKLGIYDLEGNVAEYVSDLFYEEDVAKKMIDDPRIKSFVQHRIARGGAWMDASPGNRDIGSRLKSSFRRNVATKSNFYNTLGFRCVLEQ